MKAFITILLIICVSNLSNAQGFRFDLYQHNLKTINPSFAGTEEGQVFSAFYRNSTADIDGKPNIGLLSYEQDLKSINSGLGFIFSNDRIGVHSSTNLKLIYNYQLLARHGVFAFGLGINHMSRNSNYSSINFDSSFDPVSNASLSGSNFDLDLGISYEAETIFAGIALANVLKSKIKIFEGFERKNSQYLTATLGYKLSVSDWLKVKPFLLFSHENSFDITDINLMLELSNLWIIGAMTRFDTYLTSSSLKFQYRSFAFNAGIKIINRIQLIGSYNTDSNEFTDSDYEISLIVKLNSKNE